MAPAFRPFWDGVAEGTLRFPYCGACRRFHWYPMPRCPHCGDQDIDWRAVGGPAEVYSWTVVRHAFSEAVAGQVPYVVALVTFADAPGVRLITNLVDVATDDISIGMAVGPVFLANESGKGIVFFHPIKAS